MLVQSSDLYFRAVGSYPTNIPALVQFCSANPGLCSLDPQLLSGRAGGYVFSSYIEQDNVYKIAAEPEIPGITGSVTLTIDQNVVITSLPTPGSDVA